MNPELQANGSDFLGFPEGLTRWWPVACDLGWFRIVYFSLASGRNSFLGRS
jgi:hypothetical protein